MDEENERLVPDSVIPHQWLPPLRYRDMPEPVAWTKMVGPSIILAGLALGSGEYVLWPYVTYKTGFVFFWACMLGVITQFFLNMEIARWTLATGESAVTGFCRLSRHWAWIFLILNVVPWIWPGWATAAAQMVSWTLWAPNRTVEVPANQPDFRLWLGDVDFSGVQFPAALAGRARFERQGRELVWQGPLTDPDRELLLSASESPVYRNGLKKLFAQIESIGAVKYDVRYLKPLSIAGLLLVGLVLTSGPVVYNTVERIQFWLVGLIFVLAVVLAFLVVRPDAVWAMAAGARNFGGMPPTKDLDVIILLGALAFAGAGGTVNLGQSNFIKEKGYAMGQYIGRITSPLTGNEEATSEIGYHFEHTPENLDRWRRWWRAANLEHFVSFFLTCVVCLVLLSLLTYSLCYDESGQLQPSVSRLGAGMNFVWGQATILGNSSGWMKTAYLVMGIAILLTTELGVLDTTCRISTDIVKVNFLRDNAYWTQSRLYYLFLWSEIGIGSLILTMDFSEPLLLLKTSAAMNGGVMFLYSLVLLYMNNKILSRRLSMSPLRFLAITWSCAFFGYFTWQALAGQVFPFLQSLWTKG